MSEFYMPHRVIEDAADYSREEAEIEIMHSWSECEDAYEAMLDEICPDIEIGILTYRAGDVLRSVDPVAFNCGVSEEFWEVTRSEFDRLWPEEDDEEDEGEDEGEGARVAVRVCQKNGTGYGAVYRVTPPVKMRDGGLADHVWVHATNLPLSGPETHIFACDEEGDILDWNELDGSTRGEVSLEDALGLAGYVVSH